jgi:hypothetical protein
MPKKIKYLQLSSAALFTVGTALIAHSAQAAILDDLFNLNRRDTVNYRQCVERLARRGIAAPNAASACAAATRPEDLGECVQHMGRVNVSGTDALNTCVRVRRPLEAANCVVDISRKAASTNFSDVLAGCRTSLLPERFSDCVIGVNRGLQGITTQAAIAQCLAATDYAQDVLPTFVPGAGQNPIVPGTTPPTPSPATPAPSGTGLPQRF